MQIFESADARGVNADKQRSFKDRCVTDPTMFRVLHLRPLGQLSVCIFQSAFFFAQISVKKFLERKAGENTEKYSIFNFENPYKWGISGGRNDQVAVKFRVSPVMTTSITLRIY